MTSLANQIQQTVADLANACRSRALAVVVAESCTGGWLSKVITDQPGSSAWFDRGFVTYTNAAKRELLGVPEDILDQCGAVSEAAVAAMVDGALRHSHAQLSVAISGIAGPDGGSTDKPVGTVCLAWRREAATMITQTTYLAGNREAVREQAVLLALRGLLALANGAASRVE